MSRSKFLAAVVFVLIALVQFIAPAQADYLIVGDADANLYKIEGVTVISDGPFTWGQPGNQSAITSLTHLSDGTIVAGTQAGLVGRVSSNLVQLNGDGPYSFGGGAGSVVGVSANASDNVFAALSTARAGVLNGTTLNQTAADGPYKLTAPNALPFTAFATAPGKAFLGSSGGYIGAIVDPTLAEPNPKGDGPFTFGNATAVPITAMAVNSAGNIIAGTQARRIGIVDPSSFAQLAADGPYDFDGPGGSITAIATDGLGSAFVGLDTGYVGKIDDVTLAEIIDDGPYRYGVVNPAVSPISFIVITASGNPVIGTTTGWIALLDKNTLAEIASVQLNPDGNALTSAMYVVAVPESGSAFLIGMCGVSIAAFCRRQRVGSRD